MRRLFLLIFIILYSCQEDIENLEFYGTIRDIELNSPIRKASVYIVCWKYLDSSDESYSESEIQKTMSDENGKYRINFDKGSFIEIKIRADGYKEEYSTYYLSKSKNKLDFKLRHN